MPERVDLALRLLARLERREQVLPAARSPREFLRQGRTVVAADLEVGGSELVPPSVRDTLRAGAEGVDLLSAPVAADVLALAKFDLGDQLKLRAHYVGGGLTMAVAPMPRGRNATDGIGNAVRAHEVVSAGAPGLRPRLVAHGRHGRSLRYLVEEWVDAAPVLTSGGLADAVAEVVAGLAAVHRVHGLELVPAGRSWGSGLAGRWEAVRAAGLVPAATGRQVAALVARDPQVRVSWTHGDLVASNVLRTPDGQVVLVDWEHSGVGVVGQDAAKLHLFSARPEETLDAVLDGWGHGVGAPACTAAEELALAHAYLLGRYPARRAALEGHPRARVYERQVRRQVERLEQVLARCG
ncbi:phosphotransferase [Ornithinimicrobium flavum]|uniref:phosphotransferase n=1 Tax=Ornithinimicrobium flavum TaxID=1288636 RepID=UPI00106FC288|nr:phosphotransferase [Ornithinimicrobium flavum]